MPDTDNKPVLAISSCLFGHRVRYDGQLKGLPELVQYMQRHFELLPVCPEVEIGLSVPRPAVQLSGDPEQPNMTGRDDASIEVSDAMRTFCLSRPQSLKHIVGYVFKSRSPSCGIRQIPVFQDQAIIAHDNAGLFADAIINQFSQLPICDETELISETQRDYFVQQVLNYIKTKDRF